MAYTQGRLASAWSALALSSSNTDMAFPQLFSLLDHDPRVFRIKWEETHLNDRPSVEPYGWQFIE